MRWTSGRLDTARPRGLGGRTTCLHARRVRLAVLILLLAACGAATHHRPRPTTGAIAGLARDHDSGDPVAKAEIRIRAQGQLAPTSTVSNEHGLYDLDHLAPGRYQLTALFAGQPVDVVNIDVRAGETTYVDIVFTLGRPEPIRVDFGDPRQGAIDRYRPPSLPATRAIIEGTVNDTSTRERVAGAVVTAVANDQTEQTVTDEHGRFRFDDLPPGTYAVSAYYSIGGRGQIEVRRSDIAVAGAEAVIVPLWIEMRSLVEPVADADRAVHVAVDVAVVAAGVEVEHERELDEDVERDVVEVERDPDRHAEPERQRVIAEAIAAVVVEVPDPAADPEVQRQLERRVRDQRHRVEQVVEVEVEPVAIAIVVDRAEAELQGAVLRDEVLAGEPERRPQLEAEPERLVGLERLAALGARPCVGRRRETHSEGQRGEEGLASHGRDGKRSSRATT